MLRCPFQRIAYANNLNLLGLYHHLLRNLETPFDSGYFISLLSLLKASLDSYRIRTSLVKRQVTIDDRISTRPVTILTRAQEGSED